jgi:heme exporter protein C
MDGPTIHSDLLWPLLYSAVGFSLLFFALHAKGMRNEILRRRLRSLTMAEVDRARAVSASAAAE